MLCGVLWVKTNRCCFTCVYYQLLGRLTQYFSGQYFRVVDHSENEELIKVRIADRNGFPQCNYVLSLFRVFPASTKTTIRLRPMGYSLLFYKWNSLCFLEKSFNEE